MDKRVTKLMQVSWVFELNMKKKEREEEMIIENEKRRL